MKNKVINIAILILSIFFISTSYVFAEEKMFEISAKDFGYDTYVIGTHVFTTDREYLSTEDIMWASRTIDTEDRDDMIIYYKNYNNEWVSGVTGEKITAPTSFKVTEIDKMPIQSVSINYVENNEDYSIIDSTFYHETGLMITKDSDKDYTISFNAYNFKNDNYDFRFECALEDDRALDLGNIPTTIEVLDGEFALPINISKDTNEGNYTCKMVLDENESFFDIHVGEAKPFTSIDSIGIGAILDDENGMPILDGMDQTVIVNNKHYYSKYDDLEKNQLSLNVKTYFMEEGTYSFDLKVYNKNNEDISNSFEFPTNININYYSYMNEYSFHADIYPVDRSLEAGEYKFEIYIDNKLINVIDLVVQPVKKIEFETLYDKTNGYEITENNIITSESKKEYSATFKTTGIEDGTYNIKLNSAHYYNDQEFGDIDFELKYNQTVKIENNRFTLDFVVPKGIEVANYYFEFDLTTRKDIPVRYFDVRLEVISDNSTALQLTKNKDFCSKEYGCSDSYIFGRNAENKDAETKLHFVTKGYVDGFEIYVSDEIDGTYSLLGNAEDIYHAEIENEQSFGTYSVYVPVTKTKYYKVKPYILDENNNKTYKDESNITSFTDGINNLYTYMSYDNFDENYRPIVEYDENGNANLKLKVDASNDMFIDGYLIEVSYDHNQTYEEFIDQSIDINIPIDMYGYISKEYDIKVPYGKTVQYSVRAYVIANGEKIYGERRSGAYFENKLKLGDINADHEINSDDVEMFKLWYAHEIPHTPELYYAINVNGDYTANALDGVILEKSLDGSITLPHSTTESYNITYNNLYDENRGFTIKYMYTPSFSIKLDTPTREGYRFLGWTGSNGDIPEIDVTIEEGTVGDLEFTANWERIYNAKMELIDNDESSTERKVIITSNEEIIIAKTLYNQDDEILGEYNYEIEGIRVNKKQYESATSLKLELQDGTIANVNKE